MITTILTIMGMLVNDNINTSYLNSINTIEITGEIVNTKEPDEIEKTIYDLIK